MALIIEVKVSPSSRCAKIILDKAKRIVIYLKNPAENGKANKELIALLARNLEIPQASISIVSGLISRKKKIKLNGVLTLEQVLHKLGLVIQSNLLD